jgi:tetraacyldisaccharide 4'-kinase
MRAPQFWWHPRPNFIARLLSPLGAIYGIVTAHRMSRSGQIARIPVLCIGNFTVGGAGKTPTAIAIARYLQSQGETPCFLSRGYGGALTGPCIVDLTTHQAKDVGDEALLLARVAPTLIGADRIASARLAAQLGASLIILDDGLQNPQLKHDFRLAVVDGKSGIGNGLCLPAGPLRAPLATQMATVSAVLSIGEELRNDRVSVLAHQFGKPQLTARLLPDAQTAQNYSGQKVVAFAGIGLPDKFKVTLEALGAQIIRWHAFADHHVFSLDELRALQAEAAQENAQLVTTEKDFVRLTASLSALDQSLPLPAPLPVELRFDAMPVMASLLEAALSVRIKAAIFP